MDVEVKVLAHRRGPRLESLRYKSKKRVRVHHGGRADLTALEIIAVAGFGRDTELEEKPKKAAKTASKAASKKTAAPVKAEAEAPNAEAKAEAKPAKRATRKQSEGADSASSSRLARKESE